MNGSNEGTTKTEVSILNIQIDQWRSLAEQRQTMIDRYSEALKAQAFRLGTQDRELIQLRSRAKAAEAGDLATLRINNAFQRSEIMRLKAALAAKETEVAVWKRSMWQEMAERTDTRNDLMLETHYAAGLLDSVKALEEDLAAAKKWIVDLTAERDEAKAAAKRGTEEAKRLVAITEHSNNLAQNRLEELAKLRRELAVARDASAKLEANYTDALSEVESYKVRQRELIEALKAEQSLVTEQRQAINMQNSALIAAQEEVSEWKAAHERRIATIRHLEAKLAEQANAATWRAVSNVAS